MTNGQELGRAVASVAHGVMELHAGMHKYTRRSKRTFTSSGPQDLLGLSEDFVTCEMNDKDKWLTVEIRQLTSTLFFIIFFDGN